MKKLLFVFLNLVISTSLIISFLVNITAAAAADVQINITQPGNVKVTKFGSLLGSTISLIMVLATLAAFIFLIWGGIQWITSGGDKSGVESAQHRIQAAILGLFIVFAAWAIMNLAGQFFGFDLSTLSFTKLQD